jgi:hypothetical protein
LIIESSKPHMQSTKRTQRGFKQEAGNQPHPVTADPGT